MSELDRLRAMRDRLAKLLEPDACERAFQEWKAAGYPAPPPPAPPCFRVIKGGMQ